MSKYVTILAILMTALGLMKLIGHGSFTLTYQDIAFVGMVTVLIGLDDLIEAIKGKGP